MESSTDTAGTIVSTRKAAATGTPATIRARKVMICPFRSRIECKRLPDKTILDVYLLRRLQNISENAASGRRPHNQAGVPNETGPPLFGGEPVKTSLRRLITST
jgi:hypothetical protein